MSTPATFCNLPLSTAIHQDQDTSMLSLDWVLQTGIHAVRSAASGHLMLPAVDCMFSVQMDLSVASSLPFDLVLGRDWLQYCREAVPDTCFHLSSSLVDLRHTPISTQSLPFQVLSQSILAYTASSLTLDEEFQTTDIEPGLSRSQHDMLADCVCADQSSCACASTSHIPKTNMINDDTTINSANIIHAIFIGHHTTCAQPSVFHADLSAIRHALLLHGVLYNDMSLVQCQQALTHHIITGTCFHNPSNSEDTFLSLQHELSTC
ncbi:hypothetical protein DFH08DRAFT_906461 [Mycena albidolilacea]|uniref:Uncharacterized protein n=1 Tax=Mycena albidolilacea TaxID=1033008 RepID=A0AAD7E7B9_9AGAR|nr:hypothetical protein DFH08DRAFT_906461 [Mycena albidolilacea]